MIVGILDQDGDAVYINTAYIVRLDVTDTPQLYIMEKPIVWLTKAQANALLLLLMHHNNAVSQGKASYGDVPNTWAIDPDGDVGPLFAFDERAYTIAEGVDIPDDDDLDGAIVDDGDDDDDGGCGCRDMSGWPDVEPDVDDWSEDIAYRFPANPDFPF